MPGPGCPAYSTRTDTARCRRSHPPQPRPARLPRVPPRALGPLHRPGAEAGAGVPGLLDPHRHGALTLINAPGAGLGEIPGLAGFLATAAARPPGGGGGPRAARVAL